jgi:hypothetical protein
MCVTAEPAIISGTRTYVYATELSGDPVHVCGYQNEARTLEGGNCMFLNFAGTRLRLVRGPEHTRRFMRDMTDELPELIYIPHMRGGSPRTVPCGSSIEDYGDYTVILAQEPGDILSVLDQVPARRRPTYSARLRDMVDFYMSWSGQDSFVLACFDGSTKPKHPITVSYQPRNADVLTIPGLDGHDGKVPTIGAPVNRDFKVAFAVNGVQLPYAVSYRDHVAGMSWAPSSVTGFADNRTDGPNGDYVVLVEAVRQGLEGPELAAALL